MIFYLKKRIILRSHQSFTKNQNMKRIICACLAIIVITNCYSQMNTTNQPAALTGEQMMKKAKKEYGKAWALLGTGSALVITGFAIGRGDENNNGKMFYETRDGWYYMLIGLGTVFTATSISQFVTATRTKQQAELVLKKESVMITPTIRAISQFKVGVAIRL
jgi:hypothetical protein